MEVAHQLVVWPSIGSQPVRPTFEDGMFVVAYWPAAPGDVTIPVRAELTEVVTHGHATEQVRQIWPYPAEHRELSHELHAAVLLGTTTDSWWDERTGAYWVATREDLTDEGQRLVVALDRAYGVSAILLTHLST